MLLLGDDNIEQTYREIEQWLKQDEKPTPPHRIAMEKDDIIIIRIKHTGTYMLPAGGSRYVPKEKIGSMPDFLFFMASVGLGPDETTSHRGEKKPKFMRHRHS